MKKLKNDLPRVYNFSGGATSGLMTILGEPGPNDIVLFTDTKWESPGTYQFLDDFEKYECIKVHRATFTNKRSPDLEGFHSLLNYKTYLPNRTKRLCTDELKVKTAKRYLRSIGIQSFHSMVGFRADEQSRILEYKQRYRKVVPHFPLNEMGITKEMVDQYWMLKPYKLNIPRILGNCDLCFLKGKDAIIRILQHHPELADKWIAAEDHAAALCASKGKNVTPTFIKDITYRQMLKIAQSQRTLFDEVRLNELEPAFNCSCNNG